MGQSPQAFFILDNVPPVFDESEEFDHLDIPPINEDPIDVLASTYGHPIQTILESVLKLSGKLGGIYINLRGQGYLQIYPRAQVSWSSNSFRHLLREVVDEGRVEQGAEDTIVWHGSNLASLFDDFPQNTKIIGCLLGTARGNNREESSIHDFMQTRVFGEENLVFVLGNFLNYSDIEEKIDNYVQVTNLEVPPSTYVSIICNECREKWNIL